MVQPFEFDGFTWYVTGRSVQFEFVGLQPGQQCQIDFNEMVFTSTFDAVLGLVIVPGSARLSLTSPLDPGSSSAAGPIQFTAGMIFAGNAPGGSALLPNGVTLRISCSVEQQSLSFKLDGTGEFQHFILAQLSLPPTCYIATESYPEHLGPAVEQCNQDLFASRCCAEQPGGKRVALCPYGYMGEFYCCLDSPYGVGK